MWKGDIGDVTLRGQGHGGSRVQVCGRLRRSEGCAFFFFSFIFLCSFLCVPTRFSFRVWGSFGVTEMHVELHSMVLNKERASHTFIYLENTMLFLTVFLFFKLSVHGLLYNAK